MKNDPVKRQYMYAMKSEAIIFDMDGVLVNTEHHHIMIERGLFRKLGIGVTDEEHITYMGTATALMWERIAKNHNIQIPVKELIELNKAGIISHFTNEPEIEVMPGIPDLLKQISEMNIPLAVASSSDSATIDLILTRTGLMKYFPIRVSADMVKNSKPEPDIFLLAAEKLNTDPSKCIVIEDSSNGIKAAKAAGMFCVAYKGDSPWEVDHSQADLRIHDFGKLLPQLRDRF